jgi:hypothetical protein
MKTPPKRLLDQAKDIIRLQHHSICFKDYKLLDRSVPRREALPQGRTSAL